MNEYFIKSKQLYKEIFNNLKKNGLDANLLHEDDLGFILDLTYKEYISLNRNIIFKEINYKITLEKLVTKHLQDKNTTLTDFQIYYNYKI